MDWVNAPGACRDVDLGGCGGHLLTPLRLQLLLLQLI